MSSQLFKRSGDALFCEVGEDVVALNVERGQCYGMEKVTATIWSLLAEPTTVESICEQLVELYDVPPDICHADVERVIAQFRSEGLIEDIARP